MSTNPGSKGKRSHGSVKLLWATPFFLLALVVAFSGLSSDRAWPVAALLLVGIVIAVVPEDFWREALANVENASFGPINIGLRKAAGEAAAIAEPDTSEGFDEEPGKAENVFDLRIRLEYKLAFIAKHMLAETVGPRSSPSAVSSTTVTSAPRRPVRHTASSTSGRRSWRNCRMPSGRNS